MKTKIFCLFLAIVIAITAKAQNNIGELKIGDPMPNIYLPYIIQYKTTSAKFSDFQKKLTIIDFWGTGCASCIVSFPKIGELQKRFADNVQFIFVNEQGRDSTLRFFAKRKMALPGIPFVIGDSILIKYFPHFLVPQHIWIDSLGKIIAITNGWNTTPERIEQYLNGQQMHMAVKKDLDLKIAAPFINGTRPWISYPDTSILSTVKYYSYLMRPISGEGGIESTQRTMGSNKTNKLFINGRSAVNLLATAYQEGKYNFHGNNIILEVRDTTNFLPPADNNKFDDWAAKNYYAYEIFTIPSKADRIYKFMQQDLERYFDLTCKIEKRKINCLVLVRTSRMNKLKTKGGKPELHFFQKNALIKYLKNWPISSLITTLDVIVTNTFPTPFINATNYSGNIDFAINASDLPEHPPYNMLNIRKGLQKYGLDLVEKKMLMDVLVIKENGYTPPKFHHKHNSL